MGFRDYNPGLNRFLTRDTYTGALDDLNLGTDPYTGNRYAFAGGNPITGIELDGHLAGGAQCGPDGIRCGMDPNYNSAGRAIDASAAGAGTDFHHGSDITTTVTNDHSYINGLQLPDSAPPSGVLADRMAADLPAYRERLRVMQDSEEITPVNVLALIGRACSDDRNLCSREFEQWVSKVHFALKTMVRESKLAPTAAFRR